MSLSVLNALLRLDPDQIIVSINSDTVGSRAADDIYNKLARYFDFRQLRTHLPPLKDWNECLKKDPQIIKDWAKTL